MAMEGSRFKPGDLVLYRRVLSIPCEPEKAVILEESTDRPGNWLLDLGPTAYAAPHNRTLEINSDRHLEAYSAEFPFTLDEQYDRYIAYAARNDLELSKDEFEVDGEELTLDGMDPGEWIEAMTMD